jgi:putative ABC transport system permease protein
MLAVRIGERDPINQGWNVCVIGLRDQMVASVRPSLWVLLGGAGLLLLAACANVTNLLITRMMHRQSDLATRQALGATRLDLLSHVLTENLLLAGLGGVPGLWIAWWSVHLITGMSPWDIPRLGQAGMNLRVLLFWMGLVLLSGLTCGLLCAGRCLSRALTRHLQGRDAQTLAPHSRERLRGLLVVTETALSVILLIVTGLMARSFWSLQGVDPGFSPENVHTMAVSLPAAQYPEAHQQCAFFRQLLERVQDLPGVIDAGLATNLPLSGTVMTFGYNTFDHSPWDSEQNLAQYHAISSDYFKTMGITLLHGRAFSSSDRADGPQVVIVSDTLAQKLWNKSNVVGQHIGLANDGMRKREIIGVVNSVKHQGLDADLVPEVYVPYEQNPWSFMTLVVRSSGQGLFMAVTLRDQLRALDPDLPPDAIVSLADLMHTSLGPMRFRAFLIGLFSITAVLLAVVGLYAMVSYTSARRSWEFGMRIALGAQARQVLGMVLIQGLQLCLIGVTLGLTTAWALTRTLRSLLYGISPTDPAVFISAALIVTGIALLACWIPARRAAKIDPMEALRYE